MEYQYKAFISYRHSELDMKVAVEIQNRLERYRIPGSIRREHGIRSVGSIFRDKDELPSTSDLNENIKAAISSSEYLICICSPDYIESVWCRKELEFFLETHDKSHVLTVLADGDPNQVVPEILRTETVTMTGPDGNTYSAEVPLEPLSCDWRIDRHRARTEELPRLVAVLIGCRYADLRQKLRRRQMRLVITAAAACAVLLAYFIWSYLGIQKNYGQALINQSKYLASSAQDALNDNNNLLAAELSLAALPDEKTDRPIVPEALYTLSRAVGAYQSNYVLNFRCTASYEVPGGGLGQSLIASDGGHLAMVDISGDVLAAWDLQNDRMTGQVNTKDVIGRNYNLGLSGHGSDNFILWSWGGKEAALLRYEDLSVVWHQKYECDGYFLNIVSMGDEEDSPLMLISEEEMLFINATSGEVFARLDPDSVSNGQASVWYSRYGGVGIGEGMYTVCPEEECVCIAVGKEYGRNESSGTAEAAMDELISTLNSVADDKTRESGWDAVYLTGFFTYYYKTGKTVWTPYVKKCYSFSGLNRDEKGRILFSCASEPDDFVINKKQKDTAYSASYAAYVQGKETVTLLEEGTGKVFWENELIYCGPRSYKTETQAHKGSAYVYQDLRVMSGNEEHPDREVAVAATSNVVTLYDPESGKEIRSVVLPDEIISVDPQFPGDAVIRINGRSGTQYTFRYYSDYFSCMQFLTDGMDDATYFPGKESASTHSQFVVRQGETIRVFRSSQGDDDRQQLNCTCPAGELEDSRICGTTLILLDDENCLYAYDLAADASAKEGTEQKEDAEPEPGRDLWKIQLDKDMDYTIRGISGDGSCIFLRRSLGQSYYWNDVSGEDLLSGKYSQTVEENSYLLKVSAADGTAERVSLIDTENLTGAGRWYFDTYNGTFNGDHIFYRATNYNSKRSFWYRYSMTDGSFAHVAMPSYTDSSKDDKSAHIFTEDGTKGIIVDYGTGYLLDFETGKVTQFEDPFPEATKGALRSDGKMFAFWNPDDRILRVYTADGKPAWTVTDLQDKYLGKIWFYEDELFVTTEDNCLYRYRARDGKPYMVLTTNFTIWGSSKGIFESDGTLIIESGSLMKKSAVCDLVMVDLDGWAVTGEAAGVLGYCEGTRQVISVANEGQEDASIGAYQYYTAQDLIEKGRRFVGEHELTEVEKSKYGLR